MAPVRLLIAEDENLFRTTLAELLGRDPDLQIVGSVRDGRAGLLDALAERPDVLLTDLRMPTMDGIELTRRIRAEVPDTRVVILTAYDDDDNLFAALKAGAIGYVLKDATPEEVTAAIHAAHQGQGFLSPGLVARVVREFARTDRLARGQRTLFAQLTRREMEVLELLAGGLRNRQIAEKLFLSEKTVRNHISAILGKLHANDRTEAALIAARHGLGPADTGSGTSTGGS
jgi:DNA-binding NarL/FixJ family response regulator